MNTFNLKIVAVIAAVLFIFKTAGYAQHIHLDALNAYWKIADQARGGDTISREAWKNFLDLDGNKQYIANQGFNDAFLDGYRKWLQFVYNPKNEQRLKKMMENKFDYWIAYKINQYKEHETELREYASHLSDNAYLDSMYKNSWAWLPPRLHTKSPETNIYFIGIDNDALVQKGTIIFTLWTAYCQDKLRYGILGGHELHHVLRKGVGFDKVKPGDEGILYVLSAILNEGSADMIDKKLGFMYPDKVPVEYHFDELLLTHPDSIIRQIDTTMQVMAKSNGVQYATQKQYRKLINYSSGHNPGYYMADVIVRNGYKADLIKNIQNPFYFIYLYNKAAAKDKIHPPVFSAASVSYCKALEKEYWKSKTEYGK
jgi:hypothetical protein